MLKKTWNALGDIRLTFWLLMAAAAVFFIGMLYTSMEFAYFRAMNEMRIQDWIMRELPARPGINWWIPLLLAALFLLGVNTAICSINRLAELIGGMKVFNYRFLLSLLPSAVHVLFIAVMLGHAATIAAGSWTRYPLAVGTEITIGESIPPMTVTAINDSFFPGDSLLAKRISQTEVTLAHRGGGETLVSYLDSIRHHGYRLHLDMVKQRYAERHRIRHSPPADNEETCNRAETYKTREGVREESQVLNLLVISDPGLMVILVSFSLILIIMTWYFIGQATHRNAAGNPSNLPRGEES